MSLLMDIQDYLRRYGTATQPELAQQFGTTSEMVEMVAETLRAKGKRSEEHTSELQSH